MIQSALALSAVIAALVYLIVHLKKTSQGEGSCEKCPAKKPQSH